MTPEQAREAQLSIAEKALYQIANDWIELSHEKVLLQRNDYIRWAKKAIEEISKLRDL